MSKKIALTLIDRGKRVNPLQRYQVKRITNETFAAVGQHLPKAIIDDLINITPVEVTFEAYDEGKRE